MKRTNEEFSAEVFRRSNNYINKKRAQRRKVLTLCVPLCVFTVVVSAVAIPAMSGTHNLPVVEQTNTANNSNETTYEPYFHISIESPNFSDTLFSSGEQARLLAEKLDALYKNNSETDGTVSDDPSFNVHEGRYTERDDYYTVKVNAPDREPLVYTVVDNMLYTSDGGCVLVAAEEMEYIKSIIESMVDTFYEEGNEEQNEN